MAGTTESIPGAALAADSVSDGSKVGDARARWKKMPTRDRRLLGLAATVLGGFLGFVIAIRPAWTTVRDAPKRMAELDAQYQQMQRLAGESKELRGTPKVAPVQAGAALKSATDAMGAAGRVVVAGDRATLTVTNANGEQLRRWLVDARSTARARPVEATLSRGAGGYSGNVIVAMPTP